MFVKNTLYKIRQLCARLITLLPLVVSGQQQLLLNCKAPEPDKAYYESVQQQFHKLNRARQAVRNPVEVALSIKVLRKPGVPQTVSDGTVREWVSHMNEVFGPSMISFFILNDAPVFIDSEKYYNFNTADEGELTAQYDVNNAVNVYLVESFTESIGGYAYFPDRSRQSNRVFAAYEYQDDLKNKILPHELGHYFGLFHTFQGNGTPNEEVVSRNPEKANCDYSGDLICDTQADPYGKIIFIGGFDCSYPYSFFDNNSEQYTPPVNNLMSYYRNCGNIFTQGQYQLMNYGLSTRLSFANEDTGYGILGVEHNSNKIFSTGNITDASGNERPTDICRSAEAFVTFNAPASFTEEVEVWLLTTTTKSRIKVGEGRASPIKIDLTKVPEVYFRFRLQVVTKSNEVHGSLSPRSYFLMDVPEVKLSGDKEAFTGTNSSVDMRFYGGEAICTLIDNNNREYIFELYNRPGLNPFTITDIRESLNFKVKKVENKCGVGTGIGSARISVSDVPTATYVDVSLNKNYWCDERSFEFFAVGNGLLPKVTEVTLIDENAQPLPVSVEFTTTENKIILRHAEAMKGLPDKFKIAVNFEGITEQSITGFVYRAKNITPVFLNKDYLVDRGDTLILPLNTPVFEPVVITFDDGEELLLETGQTDIRLLSLDNKTYNIREVRSAGCQQVDLGNKFRIGVNPSVSIDVVRENNVCAGKEVRTRISKNGTLLSSAPTVIIYDEIDREVLRAAGRVNAQDLLTFTIPTEIKHSGFYYFRLLDIERSLSEKSNQFYISALPTVELLNIYGDPNSSQPFLQSVAGPKPITLTFADGRTKIFTEEDMGSDVSFLENGTYQITSVSNQCGTKEHNQSFIVNRDLKPVSCKPLRSEGFASRDLISVVKVEDVISGDKLYYRQDWNAGNSTYTDYSTSYIKVKRGKSYRISLENFSGKSHTGSGGGNGAQLKMWLDINRDGVFQEKEAVDIEGRFFYFNSVINLPAEMALGPIRLRVRSFGSSLDAQSVTACSFIKSGETEDYLLLLTDEQPIGVNISTSKRYYCKGERIEFSISGGNAHSTGLDIELRDQYGNTLQRVGRYKNGTHNFVIDYPVTEEEDGFSLVAVDPVSTAIVSSELFAIYLPAEIELTGRSIGTKGNDGVFYYKLKNGFDPTLYYSYNGVESQTRVYSSSFTTWLYTGKIEIKGSGEVVPLRIEGKACGAGTVKGKTLVNAVPTVSEQKAAITRFNSNGYFSCRDYVLMNPKYTVTGEFEKRNFFTIQLLGTNGFPVRNFAYKTEINAQIELKNVDILDRYRLKTIASAPYFEYTSEYVDNFSKISPTSISVKRIYLEGDTDIVTYKKNDGQLLFRTADSQLNFTGVHNRYRFTKRFTENTRFSILNADEPYCPFVFQTTALDIKVKNRAKNIPLLIADPGDICVNSKLKLRMFSETALANDNIFEYELYDSDNRVVRRGNGTADERYFSVENFGEGLDLQQNYTLRVNSTSPYLMSNVSKSFRFNPAVVAELSSAVDVNRVYIGDSVSVNVALSGQGPWRVELDNGDVYENIVDPKFKAKVVVTEGLSRISIINVTGSCGEGKVKGGVNVEAVKRPAIGLSPLASGTYCLSGEVSIEHALLEGEFIEQPNLILEMYDSEKEAYIFIKNVSKLSGSTKFFIPETALGKSVHARIRDTRSGIVSAKSEDFFVKDTPKATLTENITGFEGFTYRIPIKFDAVGSVTYSINGESPQTINAGNNGVHLVTIVLDKNVTNYQITLLTNECGAGEIINTGGSVTFLENEVATDMIVLYPNPVVSGEREVYIKTDKLLGKGTFSTAIINAQGRVIEERTIEFDEYHSTQYVIPQLPQGSYFIRFIANNLSIVKRFQVR